MHKLGFSHDPFPLSLTFELLSNPYPNIYSFRLEKMAIPLSKSCSGDYIAIIKYFVKAKTLYRYRHIWECCFG